VTYTVRKVFSWIHVESSVGGLTTRTGTTTPESDGAHAVLDAAIQAQQSVERRWKTVRWLVWLFTGLFFILGALALSYGFGWANQTDRGSALVTGAVGIAIGILMLIFSVAAEYRKSWLGSWAITYGDRPGVRWAVSPTSRDMEKVLCPRCRAPNLQVSPACWKCGLPFPNKVTQYTQPKSGT
jgi:hypothetical protein